MPTILKTRSAFTLIELMMAIIIIGILSSVVIFSFNNSAKKSRDAKRKADLHEVSKALESAKNDCLAGSYYPKTTFLSAQYNSSFAYNTTTTYLQQLGHIQKQQLDPINNATYFYGYKGDSVQSGKCVTNSAACSHPKKLCYGGAQNYMLRAKLEITSDPDTLQSYKRCENKITSMNWTYEIAPSETDGNYYVCND